MSDRLSAIEAKWADAAPGPWRFTHPDNRQNRPVVVAATGEDLLWMTRWHESTGAALSAAPEDVAWLISEVRRLRLFCWRGSVTAE